MIKVLNKHTAAIDGIPKDGVAEVDPENPGIRALIKAGHLVPVEVVGEAAAVEEPGPTAAEGRRMLAEIDRRGDRIRELEAENADLRAQLASKPARKPAAATSEG